MSEQKQHKIIPASIQSVIELAEISILLDSYDDIFSDFDPSDYKERTLSDDFIIQVKKVSRSKSAIRTSLKLLIPENKRNGQMEGIVIKRLHAYFKDAHEELALEIKKVNTREIVLSLIGIIMMLTASYISYMKPEKYHMHFLLVLFEPGGWFLLWSGLDHLVYSSKETKKELNFNLKMAKSEIKFITY